MVEFVFQEVKSISFKGLAFFFFFFKEYILITFLVLKGAFFHEMNCWKVAVTCHSFSLSF